jgi:hypothetical protein
MAPAQEEVQIESDDDKDVDDEEMAYNLNKKFGSTFKKNNDPLKRTQAFLGKVKRLGK